MDFSSAGFLASDFLFIYLGNKLLTESTLIGGSLMAVAASDIIYHSTGEQYAITQHAIAPLALIGTGAMVYQTMQKSTVKGLLSVGITCALFYFGFMDGNPVTTPGYDIMVSPSRSDPNFIVGHIGAHFCATLLPFIFLSTVDNNKPKGL
jgi:hypothetical protein